MPAIIKITDMKPLEGKVGLVAGVANKRSIAWAIAQAWHEAGAELVFTYQGDRLKGNKIAGEHLLAPIPSWSLAM